MKRLLILSLIFVFEASARVFPVSRLRSISAVIRREHRARIVDAFPDFRDPEVQRHYRVTRQLEIVRQQKNAERQMRRVQANWLQRFFGWY